MKTTVTELFNIRHPLVLSGMSWISVPKLVAAVSNAGGLGILATGVMSPAETEKAVKEIRSLTDKPFAANVTLYFPGSEMNARVLIEQKVPIINYSLGKGGWIAEAVHAYGGKVIATVTTVRHALAAQKEGADALIVTGYEAAGHGGAVTSLALIPSIADAVSIPIIAAGGFADGRGLAAAIALGAGGIAMGTRFMNTIESPVHPLQKQMSVDKTAFDTLYTDRIDGMPARMMNSQGSRRLMNKRLNLFAAAVNSREITKELGLPMTQLVRGMISPGPKKGAGTSGDGVTTAKKTGGSRPGAMKKMKKTYATLMQLARMAIGFKAFKAGTMDGDNATGVLPLGQITGIIHDTPSVREAVDRIIAQAEAVMDASAKQIG
jgi:enoyl-[acyl-carrier protein] reductase II